MDIIYREEAEYIVLEKKVKLLQEKLDILNKNLVHHKEICNIYDKSIKETEDGFKKVKIKCDILLYYFNVHRFWKAVKFS